MQSIVNDHLKETSEANQKYSKQLEINNELKAKMEEQMGYMTSTKLEASEYKLELQEKTREFNEVKAKLEAKFIQQDKVILGRNIFSKTNFFYEIGGDKTGCTGDKYFFLHGTWPSNSLAICFK